MLHTAIAKLRLSARAYHRVLKIARTIPDLTGATEIEPAHVSEAVQYRCTPVSQSGNHHPDG